MRRAACARWRAIAILVLLGVAAIAVPSRVTAQEVRGVVVLEATARPISKAFVILRDSAGAERARALSDAAGRYRLTAPAPGYYRLETAIVGLRRWRSPLLEVRVGTLEYRIEVPDNPVRLDALEVRGTRLCGIRADSGLAVSQVWEEARKALAAVAWTGRSDSLWYEVLNYRRHLDPVNLRPLGGSASRFSGVSPGSPFGSVPAESLSVHGFVRQSQENAWDFFGPDADVLLSDAFAVDHCLFLRQHDERADLIGLAFEPVAGRDLPDVEGVMWLDRGSAELRTVTFQYRNLPWAVSTDHSGGYVEFERLPSGEWIVGHWWLRMPQVAMQYRRFMLVPVVAAIRETGGHVLRMRYTSGRSLDAAPFLAGGAGGPSRRAQYARVEGIVGDVRTGVPIDQAAVFVLDDSLRAHAVAFTDARGWFSVRAPGPGYFTLGLHRHGYRQSDSDTLQLRAGTTTTVRAHLRRWGQPQDSLASDPIAELAQAVRQRRQMAIVLFAFDREEIESHQASTLRQVVATVPRAFAMGGEAERPAPGGADGCPQLYIDGYRAATSEFLETLPVDKVDAVEVFRSDAESPPEFRRPDRPAGCGTILVWTVGTGVGVAD